ncbi:hypothetical protein RM697_09495 [Ichthyenterobacterium sp. W332]|uniref:Uncharacterized protein n=1 Tax=Microcosmobacter mediterraneus TaxID=3075607 RepID=A0ABU2YP99_9FLAO|nr:hypothetical protein [Ichthyenterobacterium sp. W332]MDT0558883.1 hypothetical protein [Ichthyenterobacterium sp. W332]
MLKIIIGIVVVILLTIAIVWLIDKYVPRKLKPVINILLWIGIILLGYLTFMSVYEEIEFNKIKEDRYKVVIDKLVDIRDAQLAHKTVTGKYANNFENLVRFIDTAEFTITQRRDTTVLDVEATKRYGGVETMKTLILIDTLGTSSVKDSLFGSDARYKTMMNVPVGEVGAKFQMKTGDIEGIPVFEAKVDKKVILSDQPNNLVRNEEQVQSVDGVNGPVVKVGSLDEVNTNGNWPKNYTNKE